ncbi:hypothetical protein RMCBS344292_19315 [Rhizopus microsporus]|nr:hypothetical protein RMCBS344292_19315 [Rhizopus microsporus]
MILLYFHSFKKNRQNAWFNKNLPDYLRPLPNTEENENMSIDDTLVSELSKASPPPKKNDVIYINIQQKMGYSTETILKALKESSNNQFKVAYQLVLDNKTLFKDSKLCYMCLVLYSYHFLAEHNNIPSFLATSPPPWNTSLNTDDINHEDESSISVLSSSLPKAEPTGRERSSSIASLRADLPIIYVTGTPPPGAMVPPSRSTQPRHLSINAATKKPHKSRSKWHFGIRSRCPAWEVMLEIYRSLQNVGMEWRTVDPYHLRCRYKYAELGLVVKFDLQLYKLENNSYLVDFKNAGTKRLDADGKEIKKVPQGPFWQLDKEDALAEHMQSVYPFLDVCSKLITDIV